MVELTATLKQHHGEVRDSLSALRGFVGLLSAQHISPAQIDKALTDIRPSCDQLQAAGENLVRLLERHFGDGATGELLANLDEVCTTLGEALLPTSRVKASRRLSLERTLQPLVVQLEAVAAALDVLIEALVARPVTTDVDSLFALEHFNDPSLPDGSHTVDTSITLDNSHRELRAKPRVAALVLAMSVAFVAGERRAAACTIHVSRTARGELSIEVDPNSNPGQTQPLRVPTLIAGSEACCRTAASSCGAQISWQPNPRRAVLIWPG